MAAADDDGEQGTGTSEASTPSPRPTSTSRGQDADVSNGAPIRITFGDTELTGRLRDNATARDLAAQLPLTLTFRDHNDAEKTAPLPRELAVADAPAGHDPAAGDIGYWAPGGDFVLYYDNAAPYFDGIVRIGEIDGNVQAIAAARGFKRHDRTRRITFRGIAVVGWHISSSPGPRTA